MNIHKKSIAASTPIKIGDQILSINDHPINDILDLMYYSEQEQLNISYTDSHGVKNNCTVINSFDKPLGFEAELRPCKQCINNCIFCFIDQMPPGLRESLYVKDDDFLYSFFYGNFISLSNLTQKDINKIVDQHISPLYVSVHTTNPKLHKKVFRYKTSFNIMKTLEYLDDCDIEIHAQIVLIPGVNDKKELTKTVNDLAKMLNVTSIGIVPLGLTKYRQKLTPLQKLTQNEAQAIIRQMNIIDNQIINCADEIFLTAQMPIPEREYYNDFEQIENGIGMIRQSQINFQKNKKKIIKMFEKRKGSPVFITSVSGFHAIEPIIHEISEALNKPINAKVIKNFFFGEQVTVTGLLTWKDIKAQLVLTEEEYPIFSSGIFNYEMKTIDGLSREHIEKELQKEAVVVDELFLISK